MEKEELLQRWDALVHGPVSPDQHSLVDIRIRLQERKTILHRLNELGVYNIEGIPIDQALEDTNSLLREVDRIGQLSPSSLIA